MKSADLLTPALALALFFSAASVASAARELNPEWEPSFWFEEDNFDREHWRFEQEGRVSAGESTTLFMRHARARYREEGIEPVSDDALGGGLRHRFGRRQSLLLEGISHNFSDELSSIPSVRVGLDSDWMTSFRTQFEAGREPAETAQALRAGIRQSYAQLRGRWKPDERWTFHAFGRFTGLSDRNHRYETEAQAAYALDWVPGLQAVYLFTTDNMVERHPEYYSPHRLRQHQLGLEYYGKPTPKSWIWGRYLPGYGEEQGAASWNIHAVALSGGLQITELFSLNGSFEWNKTPTYRSSAVRISLAARW